MNWRYITDISFGKGQTPVSGLPLVLQVKMQLLNCSISFLAVPVCCEKSMTQILLEKTGLDEFPLLRHNWHWEDTIYFQFLLQGSICARKFVYFMFQCTLVSWMLMASWIFFIDVCLITYSSICPLNMSRLCPVFQIFQTAQGLQLEILSSLSIIILELCCVTVQGML